MQSIIRHERVFMALAAPMTLIAASSVQGALYFTNWTLFDALHGEGVLGSTSVTIIGDFGDTLGAGQYGSLYEDCVTDGSSALFDHAYFTPALPLSDLVQIGGDESSPAYTITFDEPVRNPTFHWQSLASTLTFPGTQPVKLSGQPTLTVQGNSVVGSFLGPPPVPYNDANGSIFLPGIFTSITFTAYWDVPPGQSPHTFDGIYFQVGGTPTSCIADVSGDQVVNVIDLLAIINSWGSCGKLPAICLEDIRPIAGDGQVNVEDLLAVIGAWGPCP